MNLDLVVGGSLGGGALGAGYLLFRFLDWIRRGRVANTDSIIERLEKSLDRAERDRDDAEADATRARTRASLAMDHIGHLRFVLRERTGDSPPPLPLGLRDDEKRGP